VQNVVHRTKPAAERRHDDILEHRREAVAHQDLGMGLQALYQRGGRRGGVVVELNGGERRTHCVGVGGEGRVGMRGGLVM